LNNSPYSWPAPLRSPLFLAIILPLLWALATLPELGVRDMRLEEGRRATPALEMVRTGDYVTPTLYGQPYLNKPPLFFYLVAGVSKVQGTLNELSARIPSVLSILLGALLLLRFSPKTISLETRALAALLFMSMPIILDKGTLGEIDAFLSLLAFAALACWWNAYDPDQHRTAFAGWIGAGIFLALAALMKGPGGPIEFYAVLLAFLLISPQPNHRSRWRPLFTLGHLAMIVVMLAPVVCWVIAMMARTGLSAHALGKLWADQMHLNAVTEGQVGAKGWKGILFEHYLPFVFRVFLMLLPWSIPAAIASFPRVMRPSTPLRPTWKLLVCAAPALILIFWIWPTGNPRYLMMLAYPVALLAAAAVMATRDRLWPEWALRFSHGAAQILPLVVLVLALAAIITETLWLHDSFVTTLIVGVGSAALSLWFLGVAKRMPLSDAPLAGACATAVLMLLGRGLFASVLLPYQAKRDAGRILHQQIVDLVPRTRPVYTALTFHSAHGEDYYNPQFYLPGPVTGVDDFHLLPMNQPLTLILRPDQWNALQSVAPDARKLGVLSAPKGPPPVWVAEVVRSSPSTRP
jgi:4-amino-4-deoxy-L-arabinose transferase-like glycosyltransferase